MNQSIISIHDIMPHTLDKIKIIIKKLEKVKCSPPTLLVVPGKNWNKNDIYLYDKYCSRSDIINRERNSSGKRKREMLKINSKYKGSALNILVQHGSK